MPKRVKVYLIAALVITIAFIGLNSTIFAIPASSILAGGFRGGCCSRGAGAAGLSPEEATQSFGGGCCTGSGTPVAATLREEEVRLIGLQFYLESTGETDADSVEAIFQDFGCHQEIHIYQDGQLIMRVGYAYGQAYKLS